MKPITEEEALLKLGAMCASAEHCTGELRAKMARWGMEEEARERIIRRLTDEKYVDDARYCRFFVRDKIRYNKWGRRKVEQALWQKQIPKEIYGPVLDAVPDADYLEVLRPLLRQKEPTIKARNDYERGMKLLQFALGRGFDMNIIRQCIDEPEAEDEDD